MKPPATLDDIVSGGLCVGCGLCQALAEPAVSMTATAAGRLRPHTADPLGEGTMDRIRVTCPGIRVDGSEPPLALEAQLDLLWGPLVGLRRAAADGTAGLATALARHIEASGQVEGVLMADGFENAPQAGVLRSLRGRLEEERFFAVFGRPCDISALWNLARLDNRVERRVVLTVSHFCQGMRPPGAAGAEASLPLRCRICPDSSGEQADIVLGLAGDGGLAESDLDDDARPQLAFPLVTRSLRGEAVVRVAVSAGAIAATSLSRRELARGREDLQARKIDLWALLTALALSRRLRPRYRSLRIWAAGRQAPWPRRWRVFRAFRQELKRPGPIEPMP